MSFASIDGDFISLINIYEAWKHVGCWVFENSFVFVFSSFARYRQTRIESGPEGII